MPSSGDAVGLICFVALLSIVVTHLPWYQFSGEVVLGIDLGTTYSVASMCRNQTPEAVVVDRGVTTVPSMVSYHTGADRPVVGMDAEDLQVEYPAEVILVAKRFIGRLFTDPAVQEEAADVAFAVVEGPKGLAAFEVNGQVILPEDVAAAILSKLKKKAEQAAGYWKHKLGFQFYTATVSVPVSFDGHQRAATHRAGKQAGFSMIRLVEEPVAAATAYRLFAADSTVSDILVYDMGGGTLDVALLRLQRDTNSFLIISTAGDPKLGGSDFDRCLTASVVPEGKTLSSLEPRDAAALVKAVEHGKRLLSSQGEAQIDTPWGAATISNDILKKSCKHLIDKALVPIDDVLQTSLAREEELHIVLAGGSSRLTPIREILQRRFGEDHVHDNLDADLAISLGASQAYGC
eukprot:Rhum_TRINITY_DN25081_c0_g2::Rhum_TRINITY_DN25081_c0_g2_i1::g.181123::m.181123/K03283/HSPA1s; heat shock 70kDa protein 1/2/6/8